MILELVLLYVFFSDEQARCRGVIAGCWVCYMGMCAHIDRVRSLQLMIIEVW